VAVWRYDSNLISQIYIDANGKKASRVIKNTGVGDWDIEFNSGNSVNPLDFGIGGITNDVNIASASALKSGLYRNTGAGTPAGTSNLHSIFMSRVEDAQAGLLQIQDTNSDAPRAFISHRKSDGNFGNVGELFHTENSVNPRDFGIGSYSEGNSELKNRNIDTLIAGGLFTGYGANHSTPTLGDNPYQELNGAFSLINIKGVNADGGKFSSQIACSTSPVVNAKIRASGSGNFGDWVDVFHSGNTNFNEFGGTATNDIIAIGFAQNSSSAKFALSINSVIAPDSVSVLGDFEIVTVAFEAVTGGANVTPQLSSSSSNKVCILDVSNLSGLTKGESLYLRQNANNSKITVNF
jgi:hypothetical protein